MVYIIVNGQRMSEEEYQEHRRQIEEAEKRAQDEAARLVRELGEAYKRCSEFMEQNPEMGVRVQDAEAREHELYLKLRANLEQADLAPRCEKVREDGTQCGGPQMKGHNYCYAHERMLRARAEKLELPALEDANAIQMAVMLVQRALIDDEISEKKAGLLLYSLQIAASNVKNTTFCEEDDEYLMTEIPAEETEGERTVRGRTVWSSRYEEDHRVIGKSTAEARRGGEEFSRRLPQMSAEGANSTTETQRHGEEHRVIGGSGDRGIEHGLG
jgi:hypothetical protein